MKPRRHDKPCRLYRTSCPVPHHILRRAEAWACEVYPTLAEKDAAETRLRDAKRRRFDVVLSVLSCAFGVTWLHLRVQDHDCGVVAHRRWGLPPASDDAPGGLAYDLARRRALSMWQYLSLPSYRTITIEMEPHL